MNDRLDIALVNTHGESDGTAKNSGSIGDELLLDVGPRIICLTCVVRGWLDAILGEELRKLVCGSSLSGEDQDWLEVAEAWRSQELEKSCCFFVVSRNGELQVKPWKIRLSHNTLRIINFKDFTDLLLSSLCCSSCKPYYSGFMAKFFLYHFVKNQIGRSEIVRPFTWAVDFVYADHRDFSAEFAEIFHEEPLRRDE